MTAERILGTVIYWFKVNKETIGKETLCSVLAIKTTGSRHKFFTFVEFEQGNICCVVSSLYNSH